MKAALFTEDPLYRSVFADGVAHGFEPASNLRDMDREGVDVAVLFPTLGLYIIWDDRSNRRSRLRSAERTNWLAEYCSHNRARLRGWRYPAARHALAVEDARAKNELALGFLAPNRLGRTSASIIFRSMCASELECRFVHEGRDRYARRSDATVPRRHVAATRWTDAGCVDLRGDGVLERFPGEVPTEAGGLAPLWLERMDEHWKHYTLGGAPRKSCRAPIGSGSAS